MGNKSLRVHSQESAEAKIFIEFVALIIRNRRKVSIGKKNDRGKLAVNRIKDKQV